MYQTHQGVRPQQYAGTVGGYYPMTTTDPFGGMMQMILPIMMMVMMMALIMPMMKGITKET
jgi:hypothetical protein